MSREYIFMIDGALYNEETGEAVMKPEFKGELTRCKDCKWWGYDDDEGVVRVCHAAKHGHMSTNWNIMIYRTHKGDFYCADAERKEGEADG